MDPIDVDTVVVVQKDGVDHDYSIAGYPGMAAYVVPGSSEEELTLWITIPLKKGKDFV